MAAPPRVGDSTLERGRLGARDTHAKETLATSAALLQDAAKRPGAVGYRLAGLSATWTSPTSPHGRVHGVSRQAVPRSPARVTINPSGRGGQGNQEPTRSLQPRFGV